MNRNRTSNPDEPVYTLTTYIAAPGTPIIDPKTGQRSESLPGHMYYMISDGQDKQGYGFAPMGHGRPIGQGEVSGDDFERYQNPVYARTIEITRDQYDKLRSFGEAGIKSQQTHFNLTYNGATNSCIDFTWGALNHAGLHQRLPLPDGQSVPVRGYDGQVLPEGNIASLQSIAVPFPDSPYNRVERNPPPPGWAEKAGQAKDGAIEQFRDKAQDVIDDLKCAAFPGLPDCPPGGAGLDSKRALPDPRDLSSPDHRMYRQIEQGVAQIDQRMGRASDSNSERLAMGAFIEAKARGLTSADHVVLNTQGTLPNANGASTPAGVTLFVVQGLDAYDERNKVAAVSIQSALTQPVDKSLEKLDTLSQQHAHMLAQQQNVPAQDAPGHGPRAM